MTRPDWDTYFLAICEAVALRADCRRRQVGALIVVGNRLAVCGYNGAPPKTRGCLEGACPRGLVSYQDIPPGSSYDTGSGFCIGLHAEQNALLDAAKRGVAVRHGTVYVNSQPCIGCYKMLAGAELSRVVYPHEGSIRSETYPFLSCYT
jgi:dCMP deaminase